MKQEKAFTLIELLVVISIIALLLAILMPALGKARNLAMIASCSGQLKQWGMVCSQYTNEYNNMFWQGWRFNTDTATTDLWFLVMWKYHQNPEFMFCPAAKLPHDKGNATAGSSERAWGGTVGLSWCQMHKPGVRGRDGGLAYWIPKGSYGSNDWVSNKTNCPKGNYSEDPRYWRTINVRGSNTIPMLGDAAWEEFNPAQFDGPPLYKDNPAVLNNPQGEIGRCCIDRHKGSVVWVFMDSSVKSIGLKGLFGQIWYKGYKPEENPYTWSYYVRNGIGGIPSGLWPDWMKGFKEYMDK
jgi:prepilin-type N-terminal cleavage/methylation domain-containing protein